MIEVQGWCGRGFSYILLWEKNISLHFLFEPTLKIDLLNYNLKQQKYVGKKIIVILASLWNI